MSEPGTCIEVFADVCCPFTHLGLQRLVAYRSAIGRDDVRLRVRAWPLEIVNGEPLDPAFISEEIDDIRDQVAPDAFAGFDTRAFPSSSLPAMTLAASAYDTGLDVGEAVSLELRDLLFEQGVDVGALDVLVEVAARHGLAVTADELRDPARVRADHAAGIARGVVGSPHFFTPSGGFFCPALDISRDARGHLHILTDPEGFDAFVASCFT
jgi:predicted DsbA family dithiol-disulfide isomerase